MVVPERPAPPRPVSGLPASEQAKILHQDYVDALSWGSSLEKKLAGLIEWVDRLYREDGQDGNPH